jgi:hypothetical protein
MTKNSEKTNRTNKKLKTKINIYNLIHLDIYFTYIYIYQLHNERKVWR